MGEEHEEGRSGEGDKRLGQRGDESRPKQPRHSHEQQYGSEFGAHDDADDHICVLLVEQLLKEAEARAKPTMRKGGKEPVRLNTGSAQGAHTPRLHAR